MPNKDSKQSTSIALFQEKTVRRVWYQDRWFFSVIDVIALLFRMASSSWLNMLYLPLNGCLIY